jgi:NADH dehydrogenase/NADH:ubiquinone oxidoreductase subunit G
MGSVTLTINNKKIKAKAGMTILEAAQANGINIPSLCHIEGQTPTGSCRICVVDVAGSRALQGACHTPVANGMIVDALSERAMRVRKAVVELMLAAHTGECVTDAIAENCMLHNLASDGEVGAPRFRVKKRRSYPAEEKNPYVRRNLEKCIMCRRCIVACEGIAGKKVLSIGYRAFHSKIITGFDEALTTDECRDCGVCIEYCPTGAIGQPAGSRKK